MGLAYYFAATAYNKSMNESIIQMRSVRPFYLPLCNPTVLTVSRAGSGSGTVTLLPGRDQLRSRLFRGIQSGTVVTLSATADGSSTFGGWTGACSGTGSCTVTMDAAKTVTATFTLKTYTITASAGSGGSITPSGAVTVNHGASQSFTITANTNYTVGGVLVDGSSVGAVTSYTFTNVTGNHTISASFAAVEDLPLMPDTIDLPKTGQTVSYVLGG